MLNYALLIRWLFSVIIGMRSIDVRSFTYLLLCNREGTGIFLVELLLRNGGVNKIISNLRWSRKLSES